MEIIRYPQAFSALACHERYFFDEKVKIFIHRNYSLVNKENLLVQCLVLGDESVGKSSLIDKFALGEFRTNRRATSGIVATKHRFMMLGLPFDLNILDAAGSLKTDALMPEHFRTIHSILLVFDMSDLKTLQDLARWYDEVVHASAHQEHLHPLLFLVGTKSDLLTKEQTDEAEIEAISFANLIRAEFWCVSAASPAHEATLIELFSRVATLSFEEAVSRKFKDEIFATNLDRDSGSNKSSVTKNLHKVGGRILRCCNKLLRWTRCKKCDLLGTRQ